MTKRKTPRTPAKSHTKTTKADQLKSLLSNLSGVTVEDLSHQLDWQPHTTRAALTRLKQAGIGVEKVAPAKGSHLSRYRIAGTKK